MKPLLDALACVEEKFPVRIVTTTPGRFMVKGVKNGTEITFELFCVEVVQETSSEISVVVGFQCQYEGTMYVINEMLETLMIMIVDMNWLFTSTIDNHALVIHMVRSVTRYS
jgi:hypothetical protein